jgi:hypothetical protein
MAACTNRNCPYCLLTSVPVHWHSTRRRARATPMPIWPRLCLTWQEVLKLEMLDNSTGTAQITWVLMGAFKGSALTIPMQSQITMNQLTGRIESHR